MAPNRDQAEYWMNQFEFNPSEYRYVRDENDLRGISPDLFIVWFVGLYEESKKFTKIHAECMRRDLEMIFIPEISQDWQIPEDSNNIFY